MPKPYQTISAQIDGQKYELYLVINSLYSLVKGVRTARTITINQIAFLTSRTSQDSLVKKFKHIVITGNIVQSFTYEITMFYMKVFLSNRMVN